MGTVPVMITWTTGVVVTAAQMNSQIRDSVNFLLGTPRCVVAELGAPHNVNSSTTPALFQWDTNVVDSDSMHSTSSNTSRVVAQTPGLFETTLYVHFPYTSGAGTYFCGIALNSGGTWVATTHLAEDTRTGSNNSSFGSSVEVTIEQYMNTGDYFEYFAAQTTGVTLTINNTQFACQAVARWVASS